MTYDEWLEESLINEIPEEYRDGFKQATKAAWYAAQRHIVDDSSYNPNMESQEHIQAYAKEHNLSLGQVIDSLVIKATRDRDAMDIIHRASVLLKE